MKKKTNPKYFDIFLINNGYDSSRLEYIKRDCFDYTVRDIASGLVGYIRY